MPPAGEDEASIGLGVVQDSLSRAGRVPVDAPRNEHRENPVASSDRPLDQVGIIGSPWDEGDAALNLFELLNDLATADTHDLIISA